MAQQNMSSKIGSSPSPTAQRVINNNKDVQQPFKTPQAALAAKFTKAPVQK
jgi:hypothetical protein